MDDVTFSAESRSLWVMSYVIGGFVIGDEDCILLYGHTEYKKYCICQRLDELRVNMSKEEN